MRIRIDHIASENKWSMATKGLTGALTAHLNAIYNVVGMERYPEIMQQVWTRIGQGSAEQIKSLGMAADNAGAVAAAGAFICMCVMGPEYKIEKVESSEDRVVMKIFECPWKNRMQEFGITHDLLSACDMAFWSQFVKTLNISVAMRHGKQMHRGDSYCEWIFEAAK